MNSQQADMHSADLAVPTDGTSAGALLREARQAAGVHIESIAFSLKVPVSKIEALENDDLDALPDAVFARALASSVCRTLKMDSVPVLALLPQTKVQPLPVSRSALNASFRDGSERSSVSGAVVRFSRPIVLAVVVLLIGAGVIAWMPGEWLQRGNDVAVQPSATGATSPLPAQPLEPLAESPASTQPGDAASSVDAAAPIALVAPEVALASAPDPIPDHAAPPAATSSTPRLQLSARGETWIQVKDAQGAVVLERILRAGESASVSQPGRLSVVVGRADVTEVRVAGEKRDIAKSARENVARFEINP